jgi:hypothetical protein
MRAKSHNSDRQLIVRMLRKMMIGHQRHRLDAWDAASMLLDVMNQACHQNPGVVIVYRRS